MNDPTGGDPIENPGFSLDTWEMVEHAWYATAPGDATHNEPDGKGQFRESSIMSVNGVYGYWEIKSSWEYNNPKHTYTTDNNGVDMGNAHWEQNFVPLNTTFWSANDYNNDNSTANQGGGYWSRLDWGGIGDSLLGMTGGAGEFLTGSAAEVGTEGLSTAVSVPLMMDGGSRFITNATRLGAYLFNNKQVGDALPYNLGGYAGKLVDIATGANPLSVGRSQAILGGTNDLLLIISPWGNAGAWKSVLETPNLWNTVSLGVSYYGGIIGLKNDVQSLPK